MSSQTRESGILDNPHHYDSGFLEKKMNNIYDTKISQYASEQMRQTDPSRAKYLSKLVTRGLKLGGRSTKKTNKNKKNSKKNSLRHRRSRYSKKNRK